MSRKWFIIKKFMNLTLRETAVYATISCYADNNNTSHITRETIASLTGLKDLDIISEHTNELVKKGLIKKDYNYTAGKRLIVYKIIKPEKDYLYVTNKLFAGNADLIGFLVKLAENRYSAYNKIYLTNKELADRMQISRPTFNKYIKIALKEGLVKQIENGYSLSQEVFPIFKTDELTEKDKSTIQALKGENNKLGKQIDWFLSLPEEDQTHSLFNEILAGLIKSNLHSLPAELLI